MTTWEGAMDKPYYSAETLGKLTDSIISLTESDQPGDESLLHFLTAAAHASDICETIKGKSNPVFDMRPYEYIETDIAEAFRIWRFRELFFPEDEQGNAAHPPIQLDLGGIKAVPVKDEKAAAGQSQLVKKASCFFLFYFWNLFHQKLSDKYEMSFSINSIVIPMLHSYAFSQLGITIKSKDNPAVQHYFDALKFGEDVSGGRDADLHFAIRDMLNGMGINELCVPPSEKYDESRFMVYRDELIRYIPSGNESRVSVPEGIKVISGGAFREIAGITTIDLPDSLEELKSCALGFIPDLTEVNISHNLRYSGDFIVMNSKIESECGDMLVIGGWLIKCTVTDDIIKIPENVVGICCDAFYNTEKTAKEIILPPGLKEIKGENFDGFSELAKINLPDELQRISSLAFNDCESLTEIIMPDSVEILDAGAFQGCASLKRVILSDNITKISEGTFVDCESIEELHLPVNLKSIGSDGINAFAGCSSLKKIVFPEHLEYIGECAFQDCEELEEIVLPDSIKTISNMAFAGCTKLKTVHLPNHDVDIAENAFEDTLWEQNK